MYRDVEYIMSELYQLYIHSSKIICNILYDVFVKNIILDLMIFMLSAWRSTDWANVNVPHWHHYS